MAEPAAKRLDLVVAEGSHFEMGRQIGAQCAPRIRDYVRDWLATVARRTGAPPGESLSWTEKFIPFIERYAPHLAEEIEGVAAGAEISRAEAYMIQLRMELLYGNRPPDACTTFALAGERTADGAPLIGQNVDLEPAVEPYATILHMKPKDGPEMLIYASTGQIGYVGINSYGLAVFGNMLFCHGWRPGFPRYLVGRLMLEQPTVKDALAAGLVPPRASSRNVILADATGAICNVELTVDEHRFLEPREGRLVHSNHYLAPDFEGRDAKATTEPRSSTRHRLARITELVTSERAGATPEDAMRWFRDHDRYPNSVCSHPVPGHRFSKTVTSLIARPATRELWATAGSPCEHEYVRYELGG